MGLGAVLRGGGGGAVGRRKVYRGSLKGDRGATPIPRLWVECLQTHGYPPKEGGLKEGAKGCTETPVGNDPTRPQPCGEGGLVWAGGWSRHRGHTPKGRPARERDAPQGPAVPRAVPAAPGLTRRRRRGRWSPG